MWAMVAQTQNYRMILVIAFLSSTIFQCAHYAFVVQPPFRNRFVNNSSKRNTKRTLFKIPRNVVTIGQQLHAKKEEQHLQQEEDKIPYRRVSDYMGGHHAGKFDFDARISGVTSLNYEKSLMFDDLAGNGNLGNRKILASINENDAEIPKWATRDIFSNDGGKITLEGTVNLAGGEISASDGVGVIIKNDEISWEPFYATIENQADRRTSSAPLSPLDLGLTIDPNCGTLAPRGGANNACDESRPYSDSWEIKVSRVPTGTRDNGVGNFNDSMLDMYLVVKTEMDQWIWKVIL